MFLFIFFVTLNIINNFKDWITKKKYFYEEKKLNENELKHIIEAQEINSLFINSLGLKLKRNQRNQRLQDIFLEAQQMK